MSLWDQILLKRSIRKVSPMSTPPSSVNRKSALSGNGSSSQQSAALVGSGSLSGQQRVWTKSSSLHSISNQLRPGLSTPPIRISGNYENSNVSIPLKANGQTVSVNNKAFEAMMKLTSSSQLYLGMATNPEVSPNAFPPTSLTRSFDDKKKIGIAKQVKGPVLAQLVIHYISFIVIVASANLTQWSVKIRFYMMFLYFNVTLYILQLSRLAYFFNEESMAPFYASLIPFALVVAISREVHQLICVLWYVSFLVIYLQSGLSNLRKHLIGYSIAFLIVYFAVILFMNFFYVADCATLWCGEALNPPIRFEQEVIWMVANCFVVVFFILLERFIRTNAITLLEREEYVNNLMLTNLELKRELRKMKMDKEADLEAPITKVITILRNIRRSGSTDDETNRSLDFIIQILASEDLFSPDLNAKTVDTEVQGWLTDLLQQKPATRMSVITNAEKSEKADINAVQTIRNSRSLPNTSKLVLPIVKEDSSGEDSSKNASRLLIAQSESELRQRQISEEIILMVSPDTERSVAEYLQTMESTNFDVFHLNQISGGHPLYFLALACLKRHKLFETFALDHARIQRFLLKIETGYLSSNPYHNATHAADVTQALNFYLTRDCLNKYLPPDELLGAILAAVIHDYQHPGVNNAFLVNQMDSLALQYNDNAVLEHFHCASAFQLMKDEKYDVLGTLPVDIRKSVREFMVSLVLATDMAVHFEQVGKFKNKMTAGGFDLEKRPDRKSVLSIAIKCADINNPSKPLHLCTKWTELIMEEFFKQGDEEKKRNMEVSMFMNRDNTDVPKCQIGFIDFIVSPLFEAWSLFMKDEVKPLLDNIASNKAYWKSRAEGSALSNPAPGNIPRSETTGQIANKNISNATNPMLSSQAMPPQPQNQSSTSFAPEPAVIVLPASSQDLHDDANANSNTDGILIFNLQQKQALSPSASVNDMEAMRSGEEENVTDEHPQDLSPATKSPVSLNLGTPIVDSPGGMSDTAQLVKKEEKMERNEENGG